MKWHRRTRSTYDTGTAAGTQLYDPYGATRSTGTVEVAYQYTGQREESALGLYDYGARWYDPTVGRFMQADSIVPEPGNPQSLNRYSYVLNNPMKYTDPTGQIAENEQDRAQRILDELYAKYRAEIRKDFGYLDGKWIQGLWALGDLYSIQKAISDLASMMGGINNYVNNIGRLLITKGGDSSWGINHQVNLSYGYSWQSSREFLFIHEVGHIWDENTDYKYSRMILEQTGGIYTGDDQYIPGGQPAITPDPLNPLEDWADSLASYLYPRTAQVLANKHYPSERGSKGFEYNYYATQRALIVSEALSRRIFY